MMVKKFLGASTREALQLVQDQLGKDALILSTKTLPDGSVEISAMVEDIPTGFSPANTSAPYSGAQQEARRSPARDSGMRRALAQTYALPQEGYEEDDDVLMRPPRAAEPPVRRAIAQEPARKAPSPQVAATPARLPYPTASAAAMHPLTARPQMQSTMKPGRNPLLSAVPPSPPVSAAAQAIQTALASRSAAASREFLRSEPMQADPMRSAAVTHRGGHTAVRDAIPIPTSGERGRREPVLAESDPLPVAAPYAAAIYAAPARTSAQIADPVQERDAAEVQAAIPDTYDAEATAAAVVVVPRPPPHQAAPPDTGARTASRAEPRTEPRWDGRLDRLGQGLGALSSDIRAVRHLLEGQLAGISWGELKRQNPARLEVLRKLLATGLSPALCRQLAEHVPANCKETPQALRWAQRALEHNLHTLKSEDDLMDAGGIYALLGTTGVGKTTTVAKLASRAVLKHGAGKVALITTDGYRIGAQDQLRIYGKILGVPVHAVTSEEDLERTLQDLANRHLILIDTTGMSQRDQRVIEQIELLKGQRVPVRRILLLAANAQGGILDEVVARFGKSQADAVADFSADAPADSDGASSLALTGCVLTKLDETCTLGAVLDVVIRHKLRLCYVTNGQRVPEDLQQAQGDELITQLFRGSTSSTFLLQQDEYPAYPPPSTGGLLDFSWQDGEAVT